MDVYQRQEKSSVQMLQINELCGYGSPLLVSNINIRSNLVNNLVGQYLRNKADYGRYFNKNNWISRRGTKDPLLN